MGGKTCLLFYKTEFNHKEIYIQYDPETDQSIQLGEKMCVITSGRFLGCNKEISQEEFQKKFNLFNSNVQTALSLNLS